MFVLNVVLYIFITISSKTHTQNVKQLQIYTDSRAEVGLGDSLDKEIDLRCAEVKSHLRLRERDVLL